MVELVPGVTRAELEHVVLMASAVAADPDGGSVVEPFRRIERALTQADLPVTILRPDAHATDALAWAPQLPCRAQQVDVIGRAVGRSFSVHESTVQEWQASVPVPAHLRPMGSRSRPCHPLIRTTHHTGPRNAPPAEVRARPT